MGPYNIPSVSIRNELGLPDYDGFTIRENEVRCHGLSLVNTRIKRIKTDML